MIYNTQALIYEMTSAYIQPLTAALTMVDVVYSILNIYRSDRGQAVIVLSGLRMLLVFMFKQHLTSGTFH